MGCMASWLPCGPGHVEEEIRCGVAGLVGDSSAFVRVWCLLQSCGKRDESRQGDCRLHTPTTVLGSRHPPTSGPNQRRACKSNI
jgi:hypothetical protein